MTDRETKRIDVQFDADISPIQQKIRQMQAEVEKLERQILRTARARLGEGEMTSSVPSVRSTLGANPDLRAALPELGPLLANLDAAAKQLSDLARLGPKVGFTHADRQEGSAATPREEAVRAATLDSARRRMQAELDSIAKDEQRKKDLADKQKQQLEDDRKKADDLRRKKEQMVEQERTHLLQTVFNARSLTQLGALATGNAGPLARNLAFGGLQLALTGRSNYGGVMASGMAALRLLRGPNNPTSANALALAGGTGEEVAAGATDASGALGFLRFLGPVGAVLGATVLGGAYLDKIRTQARVTATDLRAAIPGLDTGTQGMKLEDKLGGLQGTALQYLYSSQSGFVLGHQLGQMGVSLGSIPTNTQNTFALGRAIVADESQLPQLGYLTGILAGKQGNSPDAVAMVFQQLVKQGKAFGVSIDKLIDSFTTLEQSTNGAAVSIGGADSTISGLAAVQKLVGGSINAGALMAPAAGATGAQAISGAALLFGGDLNKFYEAQAHPDMMFDAIAGFLRRTNPGRSPMAEQVDIQMLQSAGLMDFLGAGANPQDQRRIIDTMLKGSPGQAEKLAQQLQAKEGLVSPEAWRGQMIKAANEQVTYAQKIALNTQAAQVTLGQIHNDLVDIYGALAPTPANPTGPSDTPPATVAQSLERIHGGKPHPGAGGRGAPVLVFPDGTAITADDWRRAQRTQNPAYSMQGRAHGAATIGELIGPNTLTGSVAGHAIAPALLREFAIDATKYVLPGMSTKDMMTMLIAQAQQESGVGTNPATVRTGGIGQFTAPALTEFYRQATSPYNDPTSPFYHQRYNPANYAQGIAAMAWFDMFSGSLRAYNGGGDPNYVAHVERYEPTVKVEVTVKDERGSTLPSKQKTEHHTRPAVAAPRPHQSTSGPQHRKPPPPPPHLHRTQR